MRLLAVLLLLANVAFFAWRYNQELEHRLEIATPVPPLPADAPGLTLLSELPQLPALRAPEPEPAAGAPAKPTEQAAAEASTPAAAAEPAPAAEAQPPVATADRAAEIPPVTTDTDGAPSHAKSAPPPEAAATAKTDAEKTDAEKTDAEKTDAEKTASDGSAAPPAAATTAPQEVTSTEIAGNGKPSAVCMNVGPFPRPEAFVQLKRWLLRHATSVRVDTRTVRKRQLFWLYLEANSDSAARRKIAELEQKGIKDYLLVQRGGLKNAISLGLFSSQDSVNKRLAEMNRQGYKPVVVPRFETTDLYWLQARLAAGSDNLDAIPKSLYEGAAASTIDCSEIAAPEPKT